MPRFFATADDFRAWLTKHHASERELVVGFWKVGSGKPSMTWPESVDQALCFGWIDGVRHGIDEHSYQIRFTPRKASSIWSAVNLKKYAALDEAGLIAEAGRKVFAARDPKKSNQYSFEQRKELALEPAQEKRFKANKPAWAFWQAQAPWYRRACIHWVVSAKREETGEKRLSTLIADSAAGRTIGPLTRRNKSG